MRNAKLSKHPCRSHRLVLITLTEHRYARPLNQAQQVVGLAVDGVYVRGAVSQREAPITGRLLCGNHRAVPGEAKIEAKQIVIDGDRHLHRLDMPIRPP